MAESSPFKENVNKFLIRRLARESAAAWKGFLADDFEQKAARGLQKLELKARIDHVTRRWAEHLPAAYPRALKIVLKTLGPALKIETFGDGIWYHWIHAHFVKLFGLNHPELSLKAMVEITQRGSCEFTVRPYLIQYPQKTRAFLKSQLKHPSAHVRRWISEGTRPRLPWGERLHAEVKDPSANLQLLKSLRKDSSAYVRTSIANHLNDISKDHPELAVKMASDWLKENLEHADWMARKALRGLIKQGHAGALKTLGFSSGTKARLGGLKADRKTVIVGEKLNFEFSLEGQASENLSIDYAVHFQMSAGKSASKVFKLTSKTIQKGEKLKFTKNHSFKPISTRRYYPGRHAIEILVNGKSLGKVFFELKLQ